MAYQVGVQDLRGGCRDVSREDVVLLNEQRRNAPAAKVAKRQNEPGS